MKMTVKKFFLFLSVVALLYLALFSYIYFFRSGEFAFNNINFNRQYDAIVVFFGDFDDKGDMSRESRRRFSFAVGLYKKNIGKNIIFVGGYRPSRNLSGSQLLAGMAAGMGVKSSSIFYDKTSRDTFGNWSEAEKIILSNGFRRVLLVSSVFHIARVKSMIKPCKEIDVMYTSYNEGDVIPPKSILESFREFSYNVVSYITYRLLPAGFYQSIVSSLRN